MNTFDLGTLDLDKRWRGKTVLMRQGDKSGTVITASLRDHGTALNTSGLTARWQMRLPNGVDYYRRGATYDAGTVSVTIDETTAASVAGETVGYFQVLQGSSVIASTEPVKVVILPDALADAEPSESYDSAIQDAIDALDAAVEQMPDMVEDVLADHPEWTTTVQDGSITQAKLATDLARDRERLLYRLANMLTNALPEGDVATATDAAQTPVAGLALYGKSTQDGTPTPSAPVAIESVTPNLYQQTRQAVGTTYTVSGLTFTYDSTNSATVSGTSTANAVAAWPDNVADDTLFVHVPAGTYTATSSHNVEVKKRVGTTLTTLVSYGTQRLATFTLAEDTDILVVPVLIGSGVNFTGTRVWACLFAGSTPSVGVPYGNVGLWARGKNLLPDHPQRMDTGKGITFTNNGDGSYGISGTATANAYIYLTDNSSNFKLTAGTYTLSVRDGNGANVAGVRAGASRWVNGANTTYNIAVGAKTFTHTGEGNVQLIVEVTNGTTVNATIYPQLEAGSTATAYVPYAETVTPIDLDGHELRSLPDGTRDEVTVDERGHAVLVQRVGTYTVTASSAYADGGAVGSTHRRININISSSGKTVPQVASLCTMLPWAFDTSATDHFFISNLIHASAIVAATSAASAFNALIGAEFVYPLATPVTHDLGTIDPVPLCGPDLTAQAIPTAPMQLTYERDLNTTLARLESAIATLA